MWVDAPWFFQYFESCCTESALMIGMCTINLSLPECIRLTMHHLSNFQGGSHFQHGHFSCRSTQRFLHRPKKCPQIFLSDKISDKGNGIYMEILRCISPLLCCSCPICKQELSYRWFDPSKPKGVRARGKHSRWKSGSLYYQIHDVHSSTCNFPKL